MTEAIRLMSQPSDTAQMFSDYMAGRLRTMNAAVAEACMDEISEVLRKYRNQTVFDVEITNTAESEDLFDADNL